MIPEGLTERTFTASEIIEAVQSQLKTPSTSFNGESALTNLFLIHRMDALMSVLGKLGLKRPEDSYVKESAA